MQYWTRRLRRLLEDEGGWIQAALMGAGLLGNIFGKSAESSAKGRAAEADILQRQDMLRNQQYGTAQNAQMQAGGLDLQRKGFTEDARLNRAKQAALADLMMNYSPRQVSVPGVPQANISGGTKLGEGGRAGLAEMQKQALAALLAGDKFEGGQMLAPPQLSPLPKAGKMEKIGGILGNIGNIAGGLGAAFGDLGGGGGPSYIPSIQAFNGLPAGLPGYNPYDFRG